MTYPSDTDDSFDSNLMIYTDFGEEEELKTLPGRATIRQFDIERMVDIISRLVTGRFRQTLID